MSEFTPITTQEQLNEIVGERVGKVKAKYDGYMSPEDVDKIKADYDKQIADMASAAEASAKKYADFDAQLKERDEKIKGYESQSVKQRIAHEAGLPYGAADYLKGDDEKSIKQSAEAVKALFGTKKKAAPQASTETNDSKSAFRTVLSNLKGE